MKVEYGGMALEFWVKDGDEMALRVQVSRCDGRTDGEWGAGVMKSVNLLVRGGPGGRRVRTMLGGDRELIWRFQDEESLRAAERDVRTLRLLSRREVGTLWTSEDSRLWVWNGTRWLEVVI
jgi:hypothetical protein